jgi:SAM-dependent methyltransferase
MADCGTFRSSETDAEEASLFDTAACATAVPAEAAAALAELFAPVPFAAGREISLREREARGVQHERLSEASELVAGAASAAVVARVLAVVERRRRERRAALAPAAPAGAAADVAEAAAVAAEQRRETFLDVGSGIGKPVFAAALLRPWARCAGVELLEGLHAEALALREAWRGGLPFSRRGVKQTLFHVPPEARAARIDLRCADACYAAALTLGNAEDEEDASLPDADFERPLWAAVDVALACSTCFDEQTVERMERAAMLMRPGAIFATCSIRLPAEWGWLVAVLPRCPASWGETTVYVHERRGDGDVAAAAEAAAAEAAAAEVAAAEMAAAEAAAAEAATPVAMADVPER